jgi:hypothetical protein
MSDPNVDNMLARLAGRNAPAPAPRTPDQPPGSTAAPPAPTSSPAAPPKVAPPVQHEQQRDDKLDQLLGRISNLTRRGLSEGPGAVPAAARPAGVAVEQRAGPVKAPASGHSDEYFPAEPASWRDAKLTESEVEELVLKFLLARGDASGRDVADQIKLPFALLEELLRQMKNEQWLVHRGAAAMNDYQYQLTDKGRERARRHTAHCTYFGSTPVALSDYIASVAAQSLTIQHPTAADLKAAFADLLINPQTVARLGPAINSARGLFLYGAAGNGKTSIAERVTRAFGQAIWVPRAIGIDGQIIRVYDPANHEEMKLESTGGLIDNRKIDKRWIRVRRPTIVVGGELTMDNLEVSLNTSTGICEAPMQLKSNCGTLVIDDFGRQRMSTQELLNRWIVPLEKRFDFLNLPSGKKIQVPFDQLIIFSTNLQPRDLVDEAFLRRIPYKIDVCDPTEQEFRQLFKIMAPKLGFEFREAAVDHLVRKHYIECKRPFRNCQPRDLLLQVRNQCYFEGQPLELSPEHFDQAVQNYFTVM